MHSFQRHDISNPVTSKVSYAFDSCSTDQSITLFEGLFKWKKKKKLLKWAKFILWVSFASLVYLKPDLQITVHVLTDIQKACSVASHMG